MHRALSIMRSLALTHTENNHPVSMTRKHTRTHIDVMQTCCNVSPDQLVVRLPSTATIRSPHSVAHSLAKNTCFRRIFSPGACIMFNARHFVCQDAALMQSFSSGRERPIEPSRAAASPGVIEDTTNLLPGPESNWTDKPIPTTGAPFSCMPCRMFLNSASRREGLTACCTRYARAICAGALCIQRFRCTEVAALGLVGALPCQHLQSPLGERAVGRVEVDSEHVARGVDLGW